MTICILKDNKINNRLNSPEMWKLYTSLRSEVLVKCEEWAACGDSLPLSLTKKVTFSWDMMPLQTAASDSGGYGDNELSSITHSCRQTHLAFFTLTDTFSCRTTFVKRHFYTCCHACMHIQYVCSYVIHFLTAGLLQPCNVYIKFQDVECLDLQDGKINTLGLTWQTLVKSLGVHDIVVCVCNSI